MKLVKYQQRLNLKQKSKWIFEQKFLVLKDGCHFPYLCMHFLPVRCVILLVQANNGIYSKMNSTVKYAYEITYATLPMFFSWYFDETIFYKSTWYSNLAIHFQTTDFHEMSFNQNSKNKILPVWCESNRLWQLGLEKDNQSFKSRRPCRSIQKKLWKVEKKRKFWWVGKKCATGAKNLR